jgi:hypothetical protein
MVVFKMSKQPYDAEACAIARRQATLLEHAKEVAEREALAKQEANRKAVPRYLSKKALVSVSSTSPPDLIVEDILRQRSDQEATYFGKAVEELYNTVQSTDDKGVEGIQKGKNAGRSSSKFR